LGRPYPRNGPLGSEFAVRREDFPRFFNEVVAEGEGGAGHADVTHA